MINENVNKWMTIFNTFLNLKQEQQGSSKKDADASKKPQKKPGILAWFNNEDERIWAEIFRSLDRDSQRANVVQFLEDLAPVNPQTFAEKAAKKFNQTIFRHIVTGLSVEEVGNVLGSETETGSGKGKKVVKTYIASTRVDHRREFLVWLARSVHTYSTEYTRQQLAVANIIVSDEVMESSMYRLTRMIEAVPEVFRELGNGMEKANNSLRIFNLFTGVLMLPAMWGSYYFFANHKPIFAIATLIIAAAVGIIGFKKGVN